MNKSRLSYTFSLFILFSVLVFTYQNCGDTGGASPFDCLDCGSDLDSTDPQTAANSLILNTPDTAKIENDTLFVEGSCSVVAPYNTSASHFIYWKVDRANQPVLQSNSSTQAYCNGGRYQINTPFADDNSNSYSISLYLYGRSNTLGLVSGPNSSKLGINLESASTEFFASYAPQSTSPSSWYSSGTHRNIAVYSSPPANHAKFTAVKVKINFRLTQNVAEFTDLERSAFIEIGGASSANEKLVITIAKNTRTNGNREDIIEIYTFNAFGSQVGRIPIQRAGDTVAFFEPGQNYQMDLILQDSAIYTFKLERRSDSRTMATAGQPLSLSEPFGYSNVFLNLGTVNTTNTRLAFNGISNITVEHQICGYNTANNTPDFACMNNDIP